MKDKKQQFFLSTMGPVAYHTLANFLAPSMHAQKNYSTFMKYGQVSVQNRQLLYGDTGSTVLFREHEESTPTLC